VGDFKIERDIVIEAPAEVVWKTITEPDQITRWFADRVEVDLKPGGQGYLGFGKDVGTAILVEAVDRPHRFAFRWNRTQDDDPTLDNSVLVEFTLTSEGPERTMLRVVETGVESLAWPDEEKQSYVEDHRGGWTRCFTRLSAVFASTSQE
jgi:uncharacterized protein YndB with AHSA1/START domain